jgi:NitT/TauT family transport system substrate-binding protein
MWARGLAARNERWRRGRLAGVGLLALAVLVAGCGSSGGAGRAPAGTGSAPVVPAAGGPAPAPAAAATAGASAALPPLPEPVKLVVNWTSVSGSQSGIWMTYEGGYFRELGLDVELVNITATSRAIQSMVAGEVQLGSLDPAASIQASISGADLVLLLAATNRLVFSIMTQPGIREPQALRGKSLGITRIGSSTHTSALVSLQGWGLQPDRDVALLQLQEVAAILAAMQAGQADAGVLSPPTNALARQAGYFELMNLATQGPEYPSVAVGGPRAWVNANEDVVRRFTRAYVQGLHRFKTDKPWAVEVYRKFLKVDDPVILEDTYAQFSAYFPSVPYISEEGTARLLEDLGREEPRLAGQQPSQWIDTRFLRELEASGFIRQVTGQGP